MPGTGGFRTLGRRASAFARKLAMAVVSLGLALLAGEAFLRAHATHVVRQDADAGLRWVESDSEYLVVYGPNGRRLRPNASVVIRNHFLSGNDVRVDTNSLGFRDSELAAVKHPDELRVLFLGDSITWGMALQAEEVYVEHVERHLKRAFPARRAEAINAGVFDIGIEEEIDILEERGLQVEPDVVVLAFYLNDSRPPWGFAGELGSRGWLRRRSLLAETVYRELKLVRFIEQRGMRRDAWVAGHDVVDWRRDPVQFRRFAELARYDWGAAWQRSSWQVVDRALDRLKRLSRQHGFAVAVVAFPVAYQVYAEFVDDLPQRVLQEKAGALGFEYLDLLPVLAAHRRTRLYFDQCHPTAAGSAIIGEAIAGFVARDVVSTEVRTAAVARHPQAP